MASTTVCILCKLEENEETPFMALDPDCLCCNESRRLHIRCAKLVTKLHTSQMAKYLPSDYIMCRVCTKNIIGPKSYTVNGNKITVDLYSNEIYQYWQPSEEGRTELMRQSGHYMNVGLKYMNPNRTYISEIWYFPLGSQFTKPLLMRRSGGNQDTTKHGLFTQYYTNGKLALTGNYINGRKNGEWKEYRTTGQLQFIKNYTTDTLNGEYMQFDETGFMIEKSIYKDGKYHGNCLAWYNKDKKKYDWYYINNKTDTTKNSYQWYENGNIYKQFVVTDEKHTNGKQIVRRSEFYSNGKIKYDYKFVYNPDFLNSMEPIEFPYNEYYSNGTIETTYTFIQKDKIKVETFFATGKKKEIYYTLNIGSKNGLYASWFLNGSRELLCNYNKGELLDEYARWDSDGTLLRYGIYNSNGTFVSRAIDA